MTIPFFIIVFGLVGWSLAGIFICDKIDVYRQKRKRVKEHQKSINITTRIKCPRCLSATTISGIQSGKVIRTAVCDNCGKAIIFRSNIEVIAKNAVTTHTKMEIMVVADRTKDNVIPLVKN